MVSIEIIDDNIWRLVLYYFHEEFMLQLFVAGILISFLLSFAIGANDSANSWGTSVGSGTVTLGWAYFLGSVMEVVGATLLSGDVIEKVVNGIVNIDAYTSNKDNIIENWSPENGTQGLEDEKLLVIGCMSVMLGSGIWQMVASFFSWPVAGTHCIVFGLLGFTVTAKGTDGIKNTQAFIQIVYMLFVSIIVSMVATALIYYPLYKYCIRTGSPFSGINKIVYSIITGLSVGIPVCFIILQSNKAFDIFSKIWPFTDQDTWIVIGIGLGVSFLVTLLAIFVTMPYLKNYTGDFKLDADLRFWMKKKAELLEADKMKMKEELNGNVCLEAGDTKDEEEEKEEGDSPEIKRIFRPLQIISAMTSALVHGGNDVANCIGPFVVIYLVFQEGVIDEVQYSSPFVISLWGGLGISLGLIFYGKKVIMTMGSGISSMTPSRGYCVEWVASLVGLVFTATGLMISTTQCKVGGLIGAGLAQGLVETGSPREALKYVNFKVLSGVLFSWILTIPVAFGLSSVIFLLLKYVLL